MKYFLLAFMLTACASPPKPTLQKKTPASTTEEVVVPQPNIAPAQPPPPPPAPVAAPAPPPEPLKSVTPPPPAVQVWKLQSGKLNGPFAMGHPTQLSKTKNKKGNGVTVETCYRYSTYAVVELKSSDEVGSAEVSVRHEPPRGFNLCFAEFKGKTSYLKGMIEGHFAGVAAGMIFIDGDDSSEGFTPFQIYDAASTAEILKTYRHPSEELVITKNGDSVSIDYFAKLSVKCSLPEEGEKCWKQVLTDNKVVGKTPMPDCLAAFDKKKISHKEPALVFTRARITKLGSPPRFLGGRAICEPEP